MRFVDCNLDTCIKTDKKVILFGAGQNMLFVECSILSRLKDQVEYIIDNGRIDNVILWDHSFPVYPPEKVKEEESCAIIITTSKYTSEMYEQLEGYSLNDNVEVYIFPFMQVNEYHPLSDAERRLVFSNDNPERIPRVIHSFWFSGSDKPEEYQSCIKTWEAMCPDYEIKEWNLNNYKTENPFFRKAIDVKAWAYATDFARLDVMSKYGGIYMDMDVELVKPLDALLNHKGVFPFCSDGVVELAMFMAEKNNPLVKDIFSLYDDVELPDTKEGFFKYYQPGFVAKKFLEHGLIMDGSFQEISENVFLPSHIFMPLDYCLYELHTDSDTVAIHRANAGWHEVDYTKNRVSANRELKRRLKI